MNTTRPRPAAEVDYLRRLSATLRPLPEADRTAIVAEIGGHIAERSIDRGGLQIVLDGLGAPEALGQSYLEDYELTHALGRSSPGPLLATVLARASRSVTALLCGATAALLYAIGLSFAAIAVLKPVFGANVGMWIGGQGRFQLGVTPVPTEAREVLGYWIIPLSVLAAVLCYVAATALMRFCARRLLRRAVKPALN